MKDSLDWMESRLQALIEGGLVSLLPWGNAQANLVHRLVEAMRAQLITTTDHQRVAPNIYTILINPAQSRDWKIDPALLEQIARQLDQVAGEAGIRFLAPPVIRVEIDTRLSAQDIQVTASIGKPSLSNTAALNADSVINEDSGEAIPPNAFLIVNGVDIFPLRQAVVNIGRRLDNHLVISDPRVSRTHVQLRVIHGRYTLFDLNSTGGTYVNSQRVTRCSLNPGDVISLAGVPLIFGQDSQPGQTGNDTQTLLPPGSTRAMLASRSDDPGRKEP